MKSIIAIFFASFCFISLSSFKTDTATDYSQNDNTNYAELTEIVFNRSAKSEFQCTSSKTRIVIINLEGKSIREDCVEGDNIFSSSTLTPLIRRSDFVMEIDNISYYLLDSK